MGGKNHTWGFFDQNSLLKKSGFLKMSRDSKMKTQCWVKQKKPFRDKQYSWLCKKMKMHIGYLYTWEAKKQTSTYDRGWGGGVQNANLSRCTK